MNNRLFLELNYFEYTLLIGDQCTLRTLFLFVMGFFVYNVLPILPDLIVACIFYNLINVEIMNNINELGFTCGLPQAIQVCKLSLRSIFFPSSALFLHAFGLGVFSNPCICLFLGSLLNTVYRPTKVSKTQIFR